VGSAGFGAHRTQQRSTVVTIMPVRELPQLLGTSHFRVLIGTRELGFSEVGPLSSETDVTLPPLERSHRFETVVLRRALTRSTELYDWRRKIMSGKGDRRPVTIHQLDAAGGAIVNSWRLEGAWPCRWSGPSFNAAGNDVAIEELELAYDDLVWLAAPDKPPSERLSSNPSRARKKTEGA
jgi:T4-like virus tail tube protein gp19